MTRIYADPKPRPWEKDISQDPRKLQNFKVRNEAQILMELFQVLEVRFAGELFVNDDDKLVKLMKGQLKPVSASAFWALAAGHVTYMDGGELKDLPRNYADHLHARAGEFFPPLRTVLTAPFMNSIRGIAVESGYYPGERVLLASPEIPDLSLEQALEVFKELLGDFRFADNDSALGAIALFLEPFVLVAVNGPAPMYMVFANRWSAGKTTLASGAGALALGVVPDAHGLPKSAVELPYSLAASLSQPTSFLFMDNLPDGYVIDSSDMERLITARGKVRLRPARSGSHLSIDTLLTTLVATANSPKVAGGMARRTVFIGLQPQPTGKQYRLYPYEACILRDRARYLGAVVAVLRAWREAGCPKPDGRFDGFPEWSGIVPGLVSMVAPAFGLGMPDVEAWLKGLNAQVPGDERDWAELTKNWPAQNGQAIWCQTTMLLEKIDMLSLPVITEKLGHGSERSRQIKLGSMLTARVRTMLVAGDCVIMKRVNSNNTSEYVIGKAG